MDSSNATLLVGKDKAVFASIHFDGMSGLLDCNGTITIPASSGFNESTLTNPVFIENSGGTVYRITQTWKVQKKGEDFIVRCYAEAEPD